MDDTQTAQLSPLLRLSDDVLLEIRDAVTQPTPTHIQRHNKHRDLDALRCLSRCNRRLHTLLAPEIFKAVSLNRPETWNVALGLLTCFGRCDAVLRYTRRLVVDLQDGPLTQTREPAVLETIEAVMRKLVELMREMRGLKEVVLAFPPVLPRAGKATTVAFDAALEGVDGGFILPSVESLVIDADLHQLVGKCPGLRSLVSGALSMHARKVDIENVALIQACGERHEPLRHFEFRVRCSVDLLQLVADNTPNLTSLAIPSFRYFSNLRKLAPILAQFRQLKILVLAKAMDLGLGFNPPSCGSAYGRPGGNELQERVNKERNAANRTAAELCFEACGSLEILWIGDNTKATVCRFSDGSVADIGIEEGLQRQKT